MSCSRSVLVHLLIFWQVPLASGQKEESVAFNFSLCGFRFRRVDHWSSVNWPFMRRCTRRIVARVRWAVTSNRCSLNLTSRSQYMWRHALVPIYVHFALRFVALFPRLLLTYLARMVRLYDVSISIREVDYRWAITHNFAGAARWKVAQDFGENSLLVKCTASPLKAVVARVI